jgi:hypothetical protein
VTDRAFFLVSTAVLALVIGLVTLAMWGSAVTDCDRDHGVVVTSESGFGWECREKKR